MKKQMAAVALALAMCSTAVADEVNRKWDCWGNYTDVTNDHTGWELSVTPNRVTLVAAEGQIVGSVAREVSFGQNWMTFRAFEIDHVLIATCKRNWVVLTVDGVPYTLRRGSWVQRNRVTPLWTE